MNTANLPDLDYGSKNDPAPTFATLDNAEDTWEKIFVDIKSTLILRGHHCSTRVRGIERVRCMYCTAHVVPACMYPRSGKLYPQYDRVGDCIIKTWSNMQRLYPTMERLFM